MKHKYRKSAILTAWRRYKDTPNYAQMLGKRFGVPPAVIHNVVYQHRKKTRIRNMEYRKKLINDNPIPVVTERKSVRRLGKRILRNIFQSQVVYVSARNFT